MADTNELKPCPFCGSKNVMAFARTCNKDSKYNPADRAFPIVRCRECGACSEGRDWSEPITAITKWNERATAATPLPADAALADAVALLRRTYQNHWPSTEIKAFLAKIDAMPDAALRALSQPEVAEVPEGFVLVPIEPTEAMIIAGDGWSITKRGELRTVYRAMLSSAPSAKGGE